jgi:hypothetical protein
VLINGVTLTDLALYPSEAVEALQHGDEIILLCSIIHGHPPLRLIWVRMCVAPRCAADFVESARPRVVQVCAMSRATLLPARPQSHERRRNAGPQLLARYCLVCDTPYPDVPVPISRTTAVRSSSQRKNSSRKPQVARQLFDGCLTSYRS